MSFSVLEILTAVLHKLGVLAEGQTPSADQLKHTLSAFTSLFDHADKHEFFAVDEQVQEETSEAQANPVEEETK